MTVSSESRTSWIPIMLGVPQGHYLWTLLPVITLSWVLFSLSYTLQTFLLFFLGTRPLVTFSLTTFNHMYIDFLPLNSFLPAKLTYSQKNSIFGSPQIDSL